MTQPSPQSTVDLQSLANVRDALNAALPDPSQLTPQLGITQPMTQIGQGVQPAGAASQAIGPGNQGTNGAQGGNMAGGCGGGNQAQAAGGAGGAAGGGVSGANGNTTTPGQNSNAGTNTNLTQV